MQIFIVTSSVPSFNEEINKRMAEGFEIIPGTTYSSALVAAKTFFSTALWREDGQIFVSCTNMYNFRDEVNRRLREHNYKAIPGTTYFNVTGPKVEDGGEIACYSVFLNRGA